MTLGKFAWAGMLLVGLGGCVSMGPNYNPDIIDQLTVGTPKSEVIAKLGKPTSVTKLGDGREQIMWIHSRGTALGTARARAAILMFDASGKFTGVVTQSSTDIH